MYFLYSQRLRTSVSFVVSNFGLTFALRYASARFKLRLALLSVWLQIIIYRILKRAAGP